MSKKRMTREQEKAMFTTKGHGKNMVNWEKLPDDSPLKSENLTRFKNAFKLAVPQAALPIEVGYQVLIRLDTIRDICHSNSISNDGLKKNLDDILKDAAKLVIQPAKDNLISNIVEISSEYLDNKQIFKDLAEKLNLDESYANNFKEFYRTSLNNYLTEELEENSDFFR